MSAAVVSGLAAYPRIATTATENASTAMKGVTCGKLRRL